MSVATSSIAPAYIHSSVKRRKNTWYSIKSGNWTDRNVWLSNRIKRYNYPGQDQGSVQTTFPQVGDDVFIGIGHTVTYNLVNDVILTVNNLYIRGILVFDTSVRRNLIVKGDIQCLGTLDMSALTSGLASTSNILTLYGVNNFINTFICGNLSTVVYARVNQDQFIMDLTYRNLTLQGNATKYPTNNLSPLGNLTIAGTANNAELQTTVPLGTYNLSVGGTTSLGGILTKTSGGTVLFVGTLTYANIIGKLDFTVGNPTVECRGGITCSNTTSPTNFLSGTGLWTFSTNNQSLSYFQSGGCSIYFDAPVLISGAITVTIQESGGLLSSQGQYFQFNNTIEGDNAASTLLIKACIRLNTTYTPMTILGIFDFTTNLSAIVGYVFAGNYTLPSTVYAGVFVDGGDTKTVLGNTTVDRIYSSLSPYTTLELSTYNLIVNSISNFGLTYLSKTGAGSILFTGLVTLGNGLINNFNFTGNPTVEFRGGISGTNAVLGMINSGSGQWTFSTNNQSVTWNSAGISTYVIDAPIVISGAITVTLLASNIGYTNNRWLLLDGNNAASTLDDRDRFEWQNAAIPFLTTGVLQASAADNYFIYDKAGAQNVIGQTYSTLELGGSGIKTLLGNVICTDFILSGTATINYNGFTINATNLLHTSGTTMYTNASLIYTSLKLRTSITLTSSAVFTNIAFDSADLTITFAGFTLTSTGTTSYTAGAAQKVWGTANLIVNNLTLGGTGPLVAGVAQPINKTLQGNVSVPGTYLVTGTAVKVNSGFVFGNP